MQGYVRLWGGGGGVVMCRDMWGQVGIYKA